ncbi:hypothetical protein [Streptomyces sp. NPDC002994]|uniref:hypothetical protein n=1 Tax=Streptomyces sp. NPDC002994 TaxID=3154441 RepID=UPI0033A27100
MPENQRAMETKMVVTAIEGTDPKAGRNRRLRRSGAMAALLMSVALLAGACSGSDEPKETVAEVPGSESETPKATGKEDVLAYAKCMRQNGMPDFPDPQPGGGLGLPPGTDPNSPDFKKVEDKCKHLMGGDQEKRNGDDTWSAADKLKYSKCMRENGVSKFPDADANGGWQFPETGGDVDPQSPQFKKAEKACKKYQPQNMQRTGSGSGS